MANYFGDSEGQAREVGERSLKVSFVYALANHRRDTSRESGSHIDVMANFANF